VGVAGGVLHAFICSLISLPARISSSAMQPAAPWEAGKGPLWTGDEEGRGVVGLRKTWEMMKSVGRCAASSSAQG